MEITRLIGVEPVGNNCYVGQSMDMGLNHVYGGQALGQSLAAAAQTVPRGSAHSYHAYFLLPGDDRAEIRYEVEALRDGETFSMRRVVASQHGRSIFTMLASFSAQTEWGERHSEMAEGQGPEGLDDVSETLKAFHSRFLRFWEECGVDIRPVGPILHGSVGQRPSRRRIWVRSRSRLPDEPALHRCLLAYVTDLGLLVAADRSGDLAAHVSQHRIRMSSLDHAVWFHRDFRIDDWLCFEVESPSASQSRGYVRGQVWTRDGRLVASMAQEGLMRHVRT